MMTDVMADGIYSASTICPLTPLATWRRTTARRATRRGTRRSSWTLSSCCGASWGPGARRGGARVLLRAQHYEDGLVHLPGRDWGPALHRRHQDLCRCAVGPLGGGAHGGVRRLDAA